jgi:hypothetical protein
MGLDDTAEAVLAKLPPGTTHVLFHLNVSITAAFPACRDELIEALAARGIRTINDRVTDISRPFIHRTCAEHSLNVALAVPTVPADTPVIVKTSLNHGGKTERELPAAEVARLGLHLPDPALGPANYPVMPAGKVPGWAWHDPSLCIERFISNDAGRYHRAYLLQDRLLLWEGINPAPIKKTFSDVSSSTSRFVLTDGRYRPASDADQAPETLLTELATYVRAAGFGFGTIDAMSDNEGRYFIVDVNTTPYFRTRDLNILGHLGGASLG